MTLRVDHIAGAAFIGFGLLVIGLSGDLPVGSLSFPGSGFMPKILATLTIVFGCTLLAMAGRSPPFATLAWGDAKHAALVAAITGGAIALLEKLGFLLTMTVMMVALLVLVERRGIAAALLYSLGVVLLTYLTFAYALRTPLIAGPFGL